MNYSQIAILFLQGTLVAFTVLLLFRLRRRLGIGVLFACLGLFQFVQVILASTVYVSITNNFFVSPGSSVFFTVSLFALLIIYIKEDASETKNIIYALFIVNVIMAILLQTMGWNLNEVSTHNPFNLSTGLFDISGKVLIIGTITLFLDSLLIIVLFEFISKRVPFLFLQICLTMLIVVCFDTVVFSIFALSDLENLNSIIISGLISKGVFVIFYSILFYVYLKYFDIKERESTFLKTKDVFKLLSFKQKFESAESEIKKAEEMYRILTDHSTDLICLHEPDTTFKYISPSMKSLLGYEPSEFLGKQVFDIIHKDDIKPLQEAIEQKVFSEGLVVDDYSCRVRHKDGHFIWLEFLVSPVYKEQEISYLVSTGRDVTERVVANQEIKKSIDLLEKSEYSLTKASRMAKIGYWEYDSVKDHLTWSDYVYRIYGLDPKEETLSREEMLVFFDKESQEKLLKATSDLDSTGIPYDIELKLINRKKEEIWLRTIVQPVYNDHNEVIGRRGVLHNITESKKIQLELSTSLELLEKAEFSKNKASKMAKIGYWEYDIATDIILWSESIYLVFGFDPKEEIPLRNEILAFYDEESQKQIEQANLDLDSKGIPYDIELKLINLRKEEVWVRNVVQPIYNEKNEIVGRRGVFQDITLRKLKQDELDHKTEKLHDLNNALNAAQELAHVGSWFYDFSSQKSEWSNETFHIWGFDPEKPTPNEEAIKSRIHKDDLEIFNNATQLVYNEGASYDIEYRICLDNDEVKMIRSICKPVFGIDGEMISLNGVNQDITEQKQKQDELDLKTEKLHDLNNALNAAQELAHVGSWFYNFSSQKLEWSEEIFRIWGFDSKKPGPNEEALKSRIHKDDLEIFKTATELLYSEGTSYDIEYRICLDNDEVKIIRSICRPVFGVDGEMVSLNGVTQDITEHKLRENELDKQAEKLYELNDALNQAQKLSHIGSWQWNMATDEAEWSDEMYNIYGVTKENFYPSNESVMKTVLPEDLHKLEKGLGSLLEDEMFVPFEFRIKRPSGEIRNLYIMALEKNSQENIFGVTKDVTERKIIEEENLRIKNNYISLFDNATISIWNEDFTEVFKEINELRKLDIPNIKIYLEQNPEVLLSLLSKVIVNSVNKATLKLFKAKNSQDFLSNIENTFGEDADKVFIKLIESIWNNKQSFTSEVNYKKLNGDEFVALFSIPIPQTEVEQKTVPISIQNIQSIKDAEFVERESIKDLNAAQELARVGSWVFNVLTKESEWSDETYRIWGFDLNEIIPNEDLIQNRIHIDDREMFLNAAELVYKKRIPYDIEYRICLPNDDEKWIRSICRPILDDTGKVVLLKGTNQDITEKKRASDKIEKAEELYRLLTDNSNDVICLQEPDSTFKYMSPSIKKVLGYEPSEFIGKQIFSILHNDDIQPLKDAIEQKVFSREIEDNVYSFRARHKDGHFIWLEYLTSPVYIENEISYFVTSARDVTQRVEANEIIKTSLDLLGKSENSKNEASKMAKIGYWEFDIATDTFIWSDYLYQIYGLDLKDEIPSRAKIISLYDKESQEKVAQAIKGVGLNTPSYDLELKFTNLKNEEVWERSVVQPVYNEKNEIVGRRGVMQDITSSKKAQFELERSKKEIESSLKLLEEKEYSLRQTSNIAKIGYWEYDIETDSFTWSEYVYYIYGLDLKDEIPSRKEMVAFYDKESQEKLAEATLNLTLDGVPYDIELKIINLRKEKIWVRNVVQPVYNDKNEVVGRRGVIQDITASKNAQFQLEQSKQEIQISLELLEKSEHSKSEASKIAEIGYWEHDFITDSVIWSDYIHYIFGSNPKEGVPGQIEMLERFNKKSQEKIAQATLDLASKGIPYDVELYFVNLRNESVWVRNVAQPIYNEQKEIIGKRGVMQDITSSKKAQIELENSLYKLEKSEFTKNEVSKIAKMGYHEYDTATDSFTWSEYLYDIFGFDKTQLTFPRAEVALLFDEESKEKMKQATLDLNLKGAPYDVELKLTNLRNEEVWVRNIGEPVFNEQNEVVGRRGVTQDITSFKKAQLELEISKQKIETSLNLLAKSEYSKNEASKVAKIGFLEDDIATDTFIWSEYLYYVFGFDPKKKVPSRKVISALFDEESQEKMAHATLELDSKGIPFDLELNLINLRNEEVWVRIVVHPVYNDQNEIVKRRGVLQDITVSKKAQLELEISKIEIENSLYQLERSEFTKNEASKIAKIGYWENDIATNNYIWSDYIYHIFGVDPKEEVPPGEEIVPLFDKESQEIMAKSLLELDSNGTPVDIELKLINFKNKEVWVRNVGQAVYNDQNEIVGRRGITQDITASKKAQLELELSKQEIETSLYELEKSEYTKNEASKIAEIGYHEYDIVTDIFIWSEYLYDIFGFDKTKRVPPREEIVPLFDKESQIKMKQATLDLDFKGIPYDLELKITNLKNEEVWVRNIAEPVYNEQNELVGRRGITQNITSSKKAQLELELSKEEIQISLELLENSEYSKNEASKVAKIGYHEYEIATDTFIWSDYVYRIFGFDKKDGVPSRKEILILFDKESRKRMKEATLELDLKGTSYDLELKLINRRKKIVWIRIIAQPVYNDQNEIVKRRGILQDITASKKAQFEIELSKEEIQISLEMLGKSEHSKNEASRMAKIGHLEFDIVSDTFVWSDYLYEIFGFDSKKKIPPRSEILAFFDEVSQNKILESILELETNGTSYDIELKFINNRKEEVWARSVVQPVYNDQNEIIGRRGTFQNITASKEAQLALESSRQEIKASLELLERSEYSLKESSKVAKIAYHEYYVTTDTLIWSDYVYEIMGFDIKDGVPSREEAVSIIDKEFIKGYKQANIELMSTGNSFDIELKIFNRKKKEEIWVRNVVQPIYNDQNEIVGRRGVMQDITDRKKIEEEHLRIKDNYRRLFENATISVWNGDLTEVFKEIDELKKLDISDIKIYLKQHTDVLFSLLEKVKVNTVNKATLELFKAKDYQQFIGNIQNTFGKGTYKVFENILDSIWNNEKTFTTEINFKTLEGEDFIALFSIAIPQTKIEQKSVPVSIQSIQSIKDAELEKRKSIKKLKEAEKLANVGSWVFKTSTQESTWSEEMFFIWGFDLKKAAPELDTLLSRIHKDDLELFNNAINKAITKGISYDIEFRICPPNEEQKWIRGICQPVTKRDGSVVSLTGSNQDITDHKLATDEIEKAQEMYSLLTNNSNDIICLQELDSTFTYISPSIKNLLGYEQSDFLGKQIFDLVHKDDIQPLADAMEQRIANGVEDAATFRVRHKQGHFIWLESLSSPVYKDNEISYFVTSSRDVTEWVLARQDIQKYQTSLQNMTTEMTLIEEKQKKEIASNIHDHLSQSLVISKMKINELKKKSELKIINEDLKFIESHISEALENSRKITYELSPPVLYQLGIIDALNWLLENVEATHNIKCVVNSNVNSIKLSDANSILLYRCIQEVIKNAVKYANASLLTLNLDKNKRGINIVLIDNGDGFDTSTLNDYQNHSGSGFGLFAVQERVKNIQGEFTITSKINTGTSVKIFIPLAI
jgi:PAS domain S-box-containing protein